jgi:WXG100 family type VII secretion target
MMTGSGFSVRPEDMDALVQVLARASENIDERLGQLERTSANHLAQWSGHAQAAYAAQKSAWDKAAAHMNELLVQASSTLDSVTQNYVSVEQANMRKWMSL